MRLGRLETREARVIKRDSRVTVKVEAGGRILRLHLTNTGRLRDLIWRGAKALYVEKPGPRTHGRLVGILLNHEAALIDTQLHQRIFEELLEKDMIRWLRGYRVRSREVRRMGSRIDYLLRSPEKGNLLLEVKSATLLEEDGAATYPDAPSIRGLRQIRVLTKLRKLGARTGILFISGHPYVRFFRPNRAIDPGISDALAEAVRAGVEVRAMKLHLTRSGEIILDDLDLPVRIN